MSMNPMSPIAKTAYATRALTLIACMALLTCMGNTAIGVTLDFNDLLQAGTATNDLGLAYTSSGYTMTVSSGDLFTWQSDGSNFLESPTIGSIGSSTFLELRDDANNLFQVESIDIIDFFASQAAGNVGQTVTFYGTKADNSVVSSIFSFATPGFDKETYIFPSTFTGLVSLSWNQNWANEPINDAVANRVHLVDNLVVTTSGPPPPPLPPPPPPPLTDTIVAFGDSTTAPRIVSMNGRPIGLSTVGQNQNDSGNPPHNIVQIVDETSSNLYVYADILRDELPGLGFTLEAVDNEGIGGNRTDQALSRLNADVLGKSPKSVIVQYGINDSAHDAGPGTSSRVPLNFAEQAGDDGILGTGDDHPNASRGNYEDNLTQIIQTLQGNSIDVILMTPNQIIDKPSVTNARLGLYAQVVRDLSVSEGTRLVDVWQFYQDYADGGGDINDFLADTEHPGALGHRITADALIGLLVVPEPASFVILSLGVLMMLLRRQR